jgi:hypothetical protein
VEGNDIAMLLEPPPQPTMLVAASPAKTIQRLSWFTSYLSIMKDFINFPAQVVELNDCCAADHGTTALMTKFRGVSLTKYLRNF